MFTIEELSWIQEQIQKTGKVAPIDADKLMKRLVEVLNAKLKAKLADEAGLAQTLERVKEKELAFLGTLHDRRIALETKKLEDAFASYSQEVESKAFKRIQQAEYAESVVDSLEIVLGFIFQTWVDSLHGEKE